MSVTPSLKSKGGGNAREHPLESLRGLRNVEGRLLPPFSFSGFDNPSNLEEEKIYKVKSSTPFSGFFINLLRDYRNFGGNLPLPKAKLRRCESIFAVPWWQAIRRTLTRSSRVSMTSSCRHPQERLLVSIRISTEPNNEKGLTVPRGPSSSRTHASRILC